MKSINKYHTETYAYIYSRLSIATWTQALTSSLHTSTHRTQSLLNKLLLSCPEITGAFFLLSSFHVFVLILNKREQCKVANYTVDKKKSLIIIIQSSLTKHKVLLLKYQFISSPQYQVPWTSSLEIRHCIVSLVAYSQHKFTCFYRVGR